MAKFSISGCDEWVEGLDEVFQKLHEEVIKHVLNVSGKIYVATKYSLGMNQDGDIVETVVYKVEKDEVFQKMYGERIVHALEMSDKIYVVTKYTLERDSGGNIVETTIYKQEK